MNFRFRRDKALPCLYNINLFEFESDIILIMHPDYPSTFKELRRIGRSPVAGHVLQFTSLRQGTAFVAGILRRSRPSAGRRLTFYVLRLAFYVSRFTSYTFFSSFSASNFDMESRIKPIISLSTASIAVRRPFL